MDNFAGGGGEKGRKEGTAGWEKNTLPRKISGDVLANAVD